MAHSFASNDDVDSTMVSLGQTLSVMMDQERTTYACSHYLLNDGHNSNSNDDCCSSGDRVTPEDRKRVIEWCYIIIDQTKLNRETVAVAMNLADRFMSSIQGGEEFFGGVPSQDDLNEFLYHRGQYQLLIITCLYIAIKVNEPLIFPIADFAAVAQNIYTVHEIEDMERTILEVLGWRVSVPTPEKIGRYILELLRMMVRQETTYELIDQETWAYLEDELAFQTQNAVSDYYLISHGHRASTIGAVAIFNAIEQVEDSLHYEALMSSMICILKQFDFVKADVLLEARHRLRRFLVPDDYSDVMEEGENDFLESKAETNSYNNSPMHHHDEDIPHEERRYQQEMNDLQGNAALAAYCHLCDSSDMLSHHDSSMC